MRKGNRKSGVVRGGKVFSLGWRVCCGFGSGLLLLHVATAATSGGAPASSGESQGSGVTSSAATARVSASAGAAGTAVTYQPPAGTEPWEITGIAGLFKWGPVEGHPHVAYRFIYGDGVPARPGAVYKTAIHEISPGIRFNVLDKWRLDYTPTLRFYSNDRFRDRTDHRVSLAGTVPYGDWTFGLSQTYHSTSGTLVETARQTDQENFHTGFDATHRLGTKTFLQLGLDQHIRLAKDYPDAWEWSTTDWIGYEFNKRLSGSAGIGVGYADVEYGTDMTYEQVLGRVSWRPTDKFTFEIHGGPEIRQLLDSDLSDRVTPVYGGSAGYAPFKTTRLFVSFSRAITPSYFRNQIVETTAVNAGLRQRLLGKLQLNVGGGYRWMDYKQTFGPWTTARSDETPYVSVQLGTAFLKRGRMAVFYHYHENSSDVREYTYTSDQYGFMIGYTW